MALLPEVESKLERERKGIREENTVGSFILRNWVSLHLNGSCQDAVLLSEDAIAI